MQLQEKKAEFEKHGLRVVGLSYDNPQILADFARRKGITFPLLADSDSSSIAALGLVNPEGKGMTAGVAFPGILLLDADGKVRETIFEDSYAVRPSADSVLARFFPDSEPAAVVPKGADFALSQTGTEGIAGSAWELVVEFPLPDKAHLYAPGSEGYQPLELVLEPNPMFEVSKVEYPASHLMELPDIGESVPVYSGTVKLTVPVKVALNDETKKLRAPTEVELTGTLRYQICTDKTCFLPQEQKVVWKATIKPLDRQRSQDQYKHQ